MGWKVLGFGCIIVGVGCGVVLYGLKIAVVGRKVAINVRTSSAYKDVNARLGDKIRFEGRITTLNLARNTAQVQWETVENTVNGTVLSIEDHKNDLAWIESHLGTPGKAPTLFAVDVPGVLDVSLLNKIGLF